MTAAFTRTYDSPRYHATFVFVTILSYDFGVYDVPKQNVGYTLAVR